MEYGLARMCTGLVRRAPLGVPRVNFSPHSLPTSQLHLTSSCPSRLRGNMAGLAQNYAEFQDSAPELVIGIPAATRLAKVEGGLESSPAGADVPTSGGAKGKKRILGLAPWAAIAFALIFALLLVGVIVGSVLGTRDKKPSMFPHYIALGLG